MNKTELHDYLRSSSIIHPLACPHHKGDTLARVGIRIQNDEATQ